MKTVAIVQARMGSSRLPGKVMMKLKGRTVLSHVLERIQAIPSVDEVVVATTDRSSDLVICEEALRCGCTYFAGSEEDVLQRYFLAATEAKADTIVRITSDCPLLDPEIAENVLQLFASTNADYTSNVMVRSFPRGLDLEVFTYAALKMSHESATDPAQREHVTPYIYQHPELFKLTSYSWDKDYSNHRWTLDTPEDWELIERIYDGLYRTDRLFTWKDALDFMANNPALQQLNSHIEQKKIGQ